MVNTVIALATKTLLQQAVVTRRQAVWAERWMLPPRPAIRSLGVITGMPCHLFWTARHGFPWVSPIPLIIYGFTWWQQINPRRPLSYPRTKCNMIFRVEIVVLNLCFIGDLMHFHFRERCSDPGVIWRPLFSLQKHHLHHWIKWETVKDFQVIWFSQFQII